MRGLLALFTFWIACILLGASLFYFYTSSISEHQFLDSFLSNIYKTPDPNYTPSHKIEKNAYAQIGVVTEYDISNGYYAGGIPPKHIGVCSDVIIQALRDAGYDLQTKVYQDIKHYAQDYSDTPDKNINHRRVKNLKVFFNKYFISLPTQVNSQTLHTWKAGDIVTFEQIPGKLWHIGIISGDKTTRGVPFLIDNHGNGVEVSDILERWPSPISGHYRVPEKFMNIDL